LWRWSLPLKKRPRSLRDESYWVKGIGHANDVGKTGLEGSDDPGFTFGQTPVTWVAAKEAYEQAGTQIL